MAQVYKGVTLPPGVTIKLPTGSSTSTTSQQQQQQPTPHAIPLSLRFYSHLTEQSQMYDMDDTPPLRKAVLGIGLEDAHKPPSFDTLSKYKHVHLHPNNGSFNNERGSWVVTVDELQNIVLWNHAKRTIVLRTHPLELESRRYSGVAREETQRRHQHHHHHRSSSSSSNTTTTTNHPRNRHPNERSRKTPPKVKKEELTMMKHPNEDRIDADEGAAAESAAASSRSSSPIANNNNNNEDDDDVVETETETKVQKISSSYSNEKEKEKEKKQIKNFTHYRISNLHHRASSPGSILGLTFWDKHLPPPPPIQKDFTQKDFTQNNFSQQKTFSGLVGYRPLRPRMIVSCAHRVYVVDVRTVDACAPSIDDSVIDTHKLGKEIAQVRPPTTTTTKRGYMYSKKGKRRGVEVFVQYYCCSRVFRCSSITF